MKVLVTGLLGFTGAYLKAELEMCGHSVWSLKADLLDLPALVTEIGQAVPDAVVHLAGIAFVGHGDPNDFYRVNLMGTRNLLDALSQSKVQLKCVLLASSANIYGNADVAVISEDTPPCPVNDYAVSKLSMEYMAKLWLDRLPIVIVRPFNYTGLGQSELFLLPKIVSHFQRRTSCIELGNLDVARDFSDVRIVANIYRRILETPIVVGNIFNVCSGRVHTLAAVLDMVSQLANHRPEVWVNPAFVRANEVKVLLGSRAKLEATIGIVQDIPLEKTLE